jgi:hypothetical protein
VSALRSVGLLLFGQARAEAKLGGFLRGGWFGEAEDCGLLEAELGIRKEGMFSMRGLGWISNGSV